MPGSAAKIALTATQRKVLGQFARSRTEAPTLVQRSRVILAAADKRANQDIASEIGLQRQQVGLWRRRWRDSAEALGQLEQAEPKRLRAAIRETLSDAHRAGCGGTFTAEQVAQIMAVSCEKPSLSGRPISHWTRRELRDEVVQRGIVESISESQVGRYLQQAQLQPHRRKMWINAKEKDPEVFAAKVKQVCDTYVEAPERFEQHGTHTVCCDEMTGLQAIERAAPDRPMCSGQVERQEFEYIRHGTATVIGNWDVVQGQTFCNTVGPTRTEEEGVECYVVPHVEQTVGTDPDANWVFVVDQLNIHWSAGLVEWVAAKCEPDRRLGKKEAERSAAQPSVETSVSG